MKKETDTSKMLSCESYFHVQVSCAEQNAALFYTKWNYLVQQLVWILHQNLTKEARIIISIKRELKAQINHKNVCHPSTMGQLLFAPSAWAYSTLHP